MGLNSVGQNSAEEFFETILYGVAYDEAREQISTMTDSVDNDLVKDALQGSMSVLTSGLIFMLMRKQEDYIQALFDKASTYIVALYGSEFLSKMKTKILGRRGVKMFKKLGFFKSAFSDKIATAQVVVGTTSLHLQAERTAQSETTTVGSVTQMKEHLVNKESHNHAVGNSMASRYNETLMFKLFTKSFTANDEKLMKKILGRDSASVLEVEDMNKVADFMFVTDSNGDVTGLTEQMFQLINGLGYLHNK